VGWLVLCVLSNVGSMVFILEGFLSFMFCWLCYVSYCLRGRCVLRCNVVLLGELVSFVC